MKAKLLLTLVLSLLPAVLFAEAQFREVAADYLDFAERKDGLITPEQVEQVGPENLFLINVNSARQFKQGKNIPGSINMDWREVLDRANEIPRNKKVMVYCNTMYFSSKAQLLLNMDGYDNVTLLSGGLNNWFAYQEAKKK